MSAALNLAALLLLFLLKKPEKRKGLHA